MIPVDKLKKDIKKTLESIGEYSESMSNLILMTISNESDGGKYRKQIGKGGTTVKNGGKGISQIERRTHNDIHNNVLKYQPKRRAQVLATLPKDIRSKLKSGEIPSSDHLVNNDSYALAMTAIQYLRFKDKLPSANDSKGLFKIYKQRFNTPKGKAEEEQTLHKYHNYQKQSTTPFVIKTPTENKHD